MKPLLAEPKTGTKYPSRLFLSETEISRRDSAAGKPLFDAGDATGPRLVSLQDYPLKRLPIRSRRGPALIAPPPEFHGRHTGAKRLLRWAQYCFLLAGLAGAGWYGFVYGQARIYQGYQGWRLDRIVKHHSASLEAYLSGYLSRIPYLPARLSRALAGPAKAVTNLPAVSSLSPSNLPQAAAPSPPAEGSLIGRIEIPRLGLSTIVLEGDSASVLRKAAGRIPGTALPGGPGNVAIAGHRDTFFRALRNVRTNDTVTLVTVDGTYRYQVDSVETVRPDDTQVLNPSDRPTLTLVTCYPFYFVGSAPKRFIVRAELIEAPPITEASLVPEPSSPPAQNVSSKVAAVSQSGRQGTTSVRPPHIEARLGAHRASARSGAKSRARQHTKRAGFSDQPLTASSSLDETSQPIRNRRHHVFSWLRSL